MGNSSVAGLVLAAGKGTRMRSDRPKVMHEVFFSPMLHHVLDTLREISLGRVVVVTGHQHQQVEESLKGYSVSFVRQHQQLGTGHAVLTCKDELDFHAGPVLILCGDTPLIKAETLTRFLRTHIENDSILTVMTTVVEEPANYGRIVSDEQGNLLEIVEEKDATSEQKEIREINAGIYCVDGRFLFKALAEVGTDNMQGEVYLTDIVKIAVSDGIQVQRFSCVDSEELLGVNSRRELAQAHAVLQRRFLYQLMDSGVTIIQPDTVTIEKSVRIGKDTVIYPCVSLTGISNIGAGVHIDSFVRIHACTIGDFSRISSFSCLQHADISASSVVGPSLLQKVME